MSQLGRFNFHDWQSSRHISFEYGKYNVHHWCRCEASGLTALIIQTYSANLSMSETARIIQEFDKHRWAWDLDCCWASENPILPGGRWCCDSAIDEGGQNPSVLLTCVSKCVGLIDHPSCRCILAFISFLQRSFFLARCHLDGTAEDSAMCADWMIGCYGDCS